MLYGLATHQRLHTTTGRPGCDPTQKNRHSARSAAGAVFDAVRKLDDSTRVGRRMMTRTPKQLALPVIPQPERPSLVLNGDPGISFEVNADPWPMPESRHQQATLKANKNNDLESKNTMQQATLKSTLEKLALLRVWVRIKDALL